MPNNAAVQAEINERRAKLIKLRRVRTPYDDPKILELGYSSADSARKDFYRAVTGRREATEAEVADYRAEQHQINSDLLDVFLPIALGSEEGSEPDQKAAKLCLEIMERDAKVGGWEAAFKAELSGPGGGPVPVSAASLTQLRTLINMAGDPDADPDDEADDTGDFDEDEDDDGDSA